MEEERRRACLEGAAVPPIALAGTGIPYETSLEKVPSEIDEANQSVSSELLKGKKISKERARSIKARLGGEP